MTLIFNLQFLLVLENHYTLKSLRVANTENPNPTLFSYDSPEVSSFDPMTGPTDGCENGFFEDVNAWRARTDGKTAEQIANNPLYTGVAISIQLSKLKEKFWKGCFWREDYNRPMY